MPTVTLCISKMLEVRTYSFVDREPHILSSILCSLSLSLSLSLYLCSPPPPPKTYVS